MVLNRSIKMVFVVLALMLMAAPGSMAQDRYAIATGGTGGVYYPYGGSLASVLSDNVEDADFTAEVTSASVDNMYLIQDGDADLAFVLSDTAYDAAQGNAPFEEPVNANSLVTLYDNYTQVVVNADSGIESIEDLAGKTVSVGSPGSGTEVIALRILEAAGINPDEDISREQLGVAESAGAMKDGNIDAFFWSGGLPTAAITDLGATPNFSMKLLPTDALHDTLVETYGNFYGVNTIPAETYPGQTEDVPVITVPNVLVVNADMDEQFAYDITKAMFENQEQLALGHPEARNLTLETAYCSQALPYHPGAIRYLEEQGIAEGTCGGGGDASPAASPDATPAS
jgi:TRAP transporter TAXI family solute receptor